MGIKKYEMVHWICHFAYNFSFPHLSYSQEVEVMFSYVLMLF